MTLYYSPVLKTIASIFECVADVHGNQVILADPTVSCETSWSRTLLQIQGIAAAIIVGEGFPLYVIYKTSQLKSKGALDAHSHFSSLFQWYSPLVPYFEAFHMLRKAGLIAAGTVFGSPTTQSVIYLIINISFLILLRVLKPLVFFPCSIFKGKNLFLLAEMLGCTISIIGNLLALIGSFSQEAVNFVGLHQQLSTNST
ncbi:hypothetical protein TrRE_jg13580 [Triparma retinervis]|uniref:Uncharacterized protein n=1 Tax=Triparma retinervis TaxID=2557542 RepID=A0A9W6ZVP2_9STRA|nr:hypothetical protein TrRE_jg13580 [Triparma retinervis]